MHKAFMPSPELPEAIATQTTRARVTVALLAAVILCQIVALVTYDMQLSLLQKIVDGATLTRESLQANDLRVQLASMVLIGARVATVVAFLLWFHAAYQSLTVAGSGRTEMSPGMATLHWFIPLLNLYRPMRNVAEIWNRGLSGNTEDDPPTNVPPLVLLWWVAFIGANLLGQFAGAAGGDPRSVGSLLSLTKALIVSGLGQIVAGGLAIAVVRTIYLQQITFRERETAAPPIVAP
jgi:hypothetical protein